MAARALQSLRHVRAWHDRSASLWTYTCPLVPSPNISRLSGLVRLGCHGNASLAEVSAFSSGSSRPGSSFPAVMSASSERAAFSTIISAAKPAAAPNIKKERDPEKPKKPATPWINFLNDFRARNKASATPVASKEVMKSAAAEWKGLSPFDKRRWEEPYEAQKKEYEGKMKEYVESGKQDAWKRDPERPKKPLTGYLRFAEKKRPEVQKLGKVTEQMKEIARLWKALPEADKDPYNAAFKTDKEKFDRALAAYKEAGKEKAWEEKVGIAKQKEKKATAKQAKAKAKAKTTAKKKDANSTAKMASIAT